MKKLLVFICLIIVFSTVVVAQRTGWGGVGRISIDPTRITQNDSTRIYYVVSESRGTGTADFRCEVTTPAGLIYSASTSSTEWSGGRAIASFIYPDDFYGNDNVQPSTRSPGTYRVQCYWYIDGYGVNGKVAAAGSAFIVK